MYTVEIHRNIHWKLSNRERSLNLWFTYIVPGRLHKEGKNGVAKFKLINRDSIKVEDWFDLGVIAESQGLSDMALGFFEEANRLIE
jgi:hypothetical protein